MTDAPPSARGRGLLGVALPGLVAVVAWVASQPPWDMAPATFLVVAGFLAAVHARAEQGARAVALVGFLVGFLAFVLILPWLALPAGWLAVVLLSAVQGAWFALVAVAVRRWTTSGWLVLFAPVAWAAAEIARARVPLGGFGWADLASGHAGGSFLLGTARVVGADGLTFLTALGGTLVFVLLLRARRGLQDADRPGGAQGGVELIDTIRPPLLGLVGIGVSGLLVTIGPPPEVGSVELLLAQGNDGTNAETGRAEDLRIATALADVTIDALATGGLPDMVVWPEYALDRDPFTDNGADLAEQVGRVHAVAGVPVVAGVRADTGDDGTFANELTVLQPDGTRGSVYRKQQIVPFGEYVPWRSVLGGFPPLAAGVARDAVPGGEPAVLRVGDVDLAVAICFETLFGPIVHDGIRASNAGMVLAVTNDASYGVSAASEQHLAQSILRAVETGRTVVHASLNGVSAVVSPEGEVTARTELFDVTSLRAEVPLVTGSTPALVLAPWIANGLLVAGLLVLALAAVPARRRVVPDEGDEA